jgi:hypothetical protein
MLTSPLKARLTTVSIAARNLRPICAAVGDCGRIFRALRGLAKTRRVSAKIVGAATTRPLN